MKREISEQLKNYIEFYLKNVNNEIHYKVFLHYNKNTNILHLNINDNKKMWEVELSEKNIIAILMLKDNYESKNYLFNYFNLLKNENEKEKIRRLLLTRHISEDVTFLNSLFGLIILDLARNEDNNE